MDARRLSRSITGLALAGVLVTGVAACGDDDEDGTAATGDEATTTTAAEEETEAATESETEGEGETASAASAEFCDGVVTFNQAVTQVDIPDDASPEQVKAVGEEVIPLWDDVRDNAPEDLADEIQPLSEAVDPLAEGDGSAFNEDATFETYLGFVGQAIDACEFEKTAVSAVDYAFEGVPATMEAGTVAVELTNESEGEQHEFVVFKKNDPAQSAEAIFSLPEEEGEAAVTFAGVAFAPPGGTSSALVTLEPGSYVAVCFVPVGGTEDGPPHFTQGMLAEFTVE